jgi:hypothetical protein
MTPTLYVWLALASFQPLPVVVGDPALMESTAAAVEWWAARAREAGAHNPPFYIEGAAFHPRQLCYTEAGPAPCAPGVVLVTMNTGRYAGQLGRCMTSSREAAGWQWSTVEVWAAVPTDLRESVITHELGHALGLPDGPGGIMGQRPWEMPEWTTRRPRDLFSDGG